MGELLAPLGPNAVHLCIDMQNLFAPGAPWATPWMERVLPQARALVEHAPERTIFTRFIPPRTKDAARGVWKIYYEKWECVTREKLDPKMLELAAPLQAFAPPAAVVDRQTYCAFANGQLQSFLDTHHVDTLVIRVAKQTYACWQRCSRPSTSATGWCWRKMRCAVHRTKAMRRCLTSIASGSTSRSKWLR